VLLTAKIGGIVVPPQSESPYCNYDKISSVVLVALGGVHRFATVDIWECEESDGCISANSNFGRVFGKETRHTSSRYRDIGAVSHRCKRRFSFQEILIKPKSWIRSQW
jgi:hypothetical protein